MGGSSSLPQRRVSIWVERGGSTQISNGGTQTRLPLKKLTREHGNRWALALGGKKKREHDRKPGKEKKLKLNHWDPLTKRKCRVGEESRNQS